MDWLKRIVALIAVVSLGACGGGGSSNPKAPVSGDNGGGGTGSPSISMSLSPTTVTAAAPATVRVTLKTSTGKAAAGVRVSFSTTDNHGTFSPESTLTDSNGLATVTLSPVSATTAGADTVVATANVEGQSLRTTRDFSLVATTSDITAFGSDVGASSASRISAYGQSVLTLQLKDVSTAAPATVSVTSTCVGAGKALISPSSVTTTTSPVYFTYKDTGGCGATLSSGNSEPIDAVTASIAGTNVQRQLGLYLSRPSANNIVFVSATPETIYLQGSGRSTSSEVTFQVNDGAGNPLPYQIVTLDLTTFAGGLTLQGAQSAVSQTTNTDGRVTVLLNSGTVPTPVRVKAALANGISAVSSNLAVAVGMPSQLNFSLTQASRNIEDADGQAAPNSYTVYAADRSGNPVPDGTAITFWTESGQIEASAQTAKVNGLATATVSFASQSPRPADGRVTVVAYAIGEESFIDRNGNNVWDSDEPFQDLGDVSKDKLFDDNFDVDFDEYVSLLSGSGSLSCVTDWDNVYPILRWQPLGRDAWIPVRRGTCDQTWTQRTYVRRAVETVLSTSNAGALWLDTSALEESACQANVVRKATGPTLGASAATLSKVAIRSGDRVQTGAAIGTLLLAASDANPYRYNPMAAGTVVTATSRTSGLTVSVSGGSPVISTGEPFPPVGVFYEFASGAPEVGTFTLSFRSPSGFSTSYTIVIDRVKSPGVACTIS